VVLGGCCIAPGQAQRHCHPCGGDYDFDDLGPVDDVGPTGSEKVEQ